MTRRVHTSLVGPPTHAVTRTDATIGVPSLCATGRTLRRGSKADTARATTIHEATGSRIRALRCQVHATRPGSNIAHP